MVGIRTDPSSTPVVFAHNAVHQPGATVDSVLANLTPPQPLSSIPYLTDPAARPGQWVRYLAMVQDIWDTELFVAASPDRQSGLLVEHAAASEHPDVSLAERLPVYLVSLPGETAWSRLARNDPSAPRPAATSPVSAQNGSSRPPQQQSTLKRSRDAVSEADATAASEIAAAAATGAAQPAAVAPSPSVARPPLPPPSATAPTGIANTEKRPRVPAALSASPSPVGLLGLNTPGRPSAHVSAVVAKLYGPAASNVRLNAVVDVVGILQDGLAMSSSGNNGSAGNEAAEDATEDAFAAEVAARNPANVRRIHAVQWRVLPDVAVLPLGLVDRPLDSARSEARAAAPTVRRSIVDILTRILRGDALAAEFVLLAMIARPVRTSAQLLGKLSVNLVLPSGDGNGSGSTVGDSGVTLLLQTIRQLMASVVEVDVSIAGLNACELYARKDYEMNRLRAGALQVPAGSLVIGNETRLSDGRLAERGVRNVNALKLLSTRNVSPVDFRYYQTEIDTQCGVLLVSRGGKSIIPCDVVVRARVEDAGSTATNLPSVSAEDARRMRLGVALLAESGGQFDIGQEAASEIENAFVEARRDGRAQDGQETLQKWLAVARCCARSFGETGLSAERWRYAMNLEKERDARNSSAK